MPPIKSTTSRVLIPFLLLLLAVAFAVTGFMTLTGWQLARSPITDVWPEASRPLWSNLADIAQAVLGIPTALAGSIVALVLADRAYRTSQRQVHYETLQYIEQTVTASARDFWHLAVELRRVEEAGARLHDALLTMQTLENRCFPIGGPYPRGTDPDRISTIEALWRLHRDLPDDIPDEIAAEVSDHRRTLSSAHENFATTLKALAEQLLTLLQNPISRAVWEAGTQAENGRVNSVIHGLWLEEDEGQKFVKGRSDTLASDFHRREIVGIAQLLRLYAETMTPRAQLLGLRLVCLESLLQNHSWDAENGRWRATEQTSRSDRTPRLKRPVVTAELVQVTTSAIMMRRATGHFWDAKDPDRLAVLGALIGWRHEKDQAVRPEGGRRILFTGKTILETIIAAYPTRAVFAEAVREQLDDSRIHARDTVDAATRTAHRLGVDGYISPWLIRANAGEADSGHVRPAIHGSEPLRPVEVHTPDRDA